MVTGNIASCQEQSGNQYDKKMSTTTLAPIINLRLMAEAFLVSESINIWTESDSSVSLLESLKGFEY